MEPHGSQKKATWQESLERQADQLLLASARQTGRGVYPFYTQRWMEILAAREDPGVEELPAPSVPEDDSSPLLARLVVDAKLTKRQRQVIRLMAQGLRQCEIAGRLGISEAQVSRLKCAALREMRQLGGEK